MIPLRDTNPSQSLPVMSVLLIIANTAVFLYENTLGSGLNGFITQYALVPAKLFSSARDGSIPVLSLTPVFSSMFLHAGWIHLVGNMLYLWIFGDNVEDKMGHLRFLIFYILCGISATGLHILLSPQSDVPTLGASGAIAGVLGAYLLLFPKARVLTFVPIFFFIQFLEVPAFIFLGLWFVLQSFSSVLSLGIDPPEGGVAWWAHVGGFVAGLILVSLFRKRR